MAVLRKSSFLLFMAALAVSVLLAGEKARSSKQASTPRTYRMPPGKYHVVGFEVCAAGDTIVFTSVTENETASRGVFALRLRTGEVKKLFSKPAGVFRSPIPHRFALVTGGKPSQLIFVGDTGIMHGKIAHPNSNGYFAPRWSRDGRYVVFAFDRPGLTEDSPDFNPLGFTALGVIEADTLKLRWFSVQDLTYYWNFAATGDSVYTSDQLNENQGQLTVTAYDLSGRLISKRKQMKGTYFSPQGRYYLPQLHEFANDFEIYDAKTNKPVQIMPRFNPKTGEYYAYQSWNPKYDDLLLLEHLRETTRVEWQRLEVYSVSQGKVLKDFSPSPWAWSPDGRFLIMYRNGEFVFEPVVP